MQVSFSDNIFACRCHFEERHIPKDAGFKWDNLEHVWFTQNHGVAARLLPYLDESAKKEIARVRITIETWTRGLAVPKGEELYDYQVNTCLFSLSRNRSYAALKPGLGKTPIAAVVAQTLDDSLQGMLSVIYLSPPHLTRNAEAEFKRWAPRLTVERYDKDNILNFKFDVTIIPDSLIARAEVRNEIKNFTKKCHQHLINTILFVDEAHRFKNDTAGRTQSLFGTKQKPSVASLFNRIVYLSGTPMPNRPIELYPVLAHSAPESIHNMSRHEYALHYCGAYENQWGWDYSGATNIDELAAQITDKFMIRYDKDVLDLPEKIEEMVVLNPNMSPRLTKLSKEILNTLNVDDLMKGRIQAKLGKDDLHLSTYRKELGVLKAREASDFVKFILEETEENVLVFAIHKEVIATLSDELSKYHPLVITGDTRMELRHEYVKQFQSDKERRVFIGNIQAAGTGLTLTKATRVVFAEFSWVPADNEQASDRAHRIGQKDNVYVQYLVYENSVDKAVIETVLRKKKVTAKI